MSQSINKGVSDSEPVRVEFGTPGKRPGGMVGTTITVTDKGKELGYTPELLATLYHHEH